MSNDNNNELDLDRFKAFDKEFAKKFGDSYVGFQQAAGFEAVQRVKVDSISLNHVMGGGLPVGRIIEVFGQASAGKTALCTHIVASYQKQGKYCMWVDAEHAMSPEFMAQQGVNLDKLCKIAPESAEDALEAMRTGLKAKDKEGNPLLDLIVLDSVAALAPADDYEKEFTSASTIGKLARLMSHSLKQFAALAAKNKITILLINQERACNLTSPFGKKSDSAGGNALKYYTSMRLDLSRIGYLSEDKEKYGQIVSVETIKNKTAAPFKKVDIHIVYPMMRGDKLVAGVDVFSDYMNLALDNGLIERTGAWYTWGEKKYNGLKKLNELFVNDSEAFKSLCNQVREIYDSEEDNQAQTL